MMMLCFVFPVCIGHSSAKVTIRCIVVCRVYCAGTSVTNEQAAYISTLQPNKEYDLATLKSLVLEYGRSLSYDT